MRLLVSQTSGKLWCRYCGSNYHEIKYCPKTWAGQGNINARRCDYCGGKDHEYEHCPKLGRYAPWE